MTLLHAHAKYIYIVNAKYQKPLVKVLVQVDFLYLHKQKPYLKTKRKKMAHFRGGGGKMLLFCQKKTNKKKHFFFASTFFMQMFNESILRRQSIKLFRNKL